MSAFTGPNGSRRLLHVFRPMLVSLVAGAWYGSWAAFVHLSFGPAVALHAGLTQAALSVTATLVLALVLEYLFRWHSNPVHGFWFASVGTSVLGAAWLVVGHALAGTPQIAVAIAPSVTIGTVFLFAYARALLKHARRDAALPHAAAVPVGSLQEDFGFPASGSAAAHHPAASASTRCLPLDGSSNTTPTATAISARRPPGSMRVPNYAPTWAR